MASSSPDLPNGFGKDFDTDRSIFKDGYFGRECSKLGGYLPPAMGIKFPLLAEWFWSLPLRSCSEKGFDTDRSIFKDGYFGREY